MAATEFDIIRDEQERSNLLRAVSDIENAISISPPDTRRVLQNTLDNAKKRVTTLDKKIEEAKVEREAAARAQTTAAALAAKETKLNAEERGTYRGFLEEWYFTKKDLGKLDQFYTHSYDRLSEDGKEEMEKRIDEGIKRGEFKAGDLPESVKKRQAEFKHESSKTRKQAEQSSDVTDAHSTAIDPKDKQSPAKTAESRGKMQIDLSSVDLKGVQLVATASKPCSAFIPDASGQSCVQRG